MIGPETHVRRRGWGILREHHNGDDRHAKLCMQIEVRSSLRMMSLTCCVCLSLLMNLLRARQTTVMRRLLTTLRMSVSS